MSETGWWDVTGGKLTTYRLMAEEAVDAVARYLGREKVKCRTAEIALLKPAATTGVSAIVPPPVSESLVKHYCRNEWVRRLDDLMIRRTSWRHYRHDHAEVAARVAHWMASELGWDDATAETEIMNYRKQCGVSGAPSPHLSGNHRTNGMAVASSNGNYKPR